MARILAIDDEMDMLMLIKNILSRDSHEVEGYPSPADVPDSKLSGYDLILLDVMMPDVDGITYLREVRNKVDCPILFLTAKSMESDIVEGLGMGADDYITKPFGVNELLARVHAHLRREKREHHTSLNAGDVRIDLSAKEIYAKGKKLNFTKSEYQICELMARRRGQVFSKDQIYEMIFGYEGTGDASAISEHVKNIRAKFQKEGMTPIETVWGIGYKWK